MKVHCILFSTIVLSSILDEAGNRLALSEDWLNILTSSFVPLNPKLGVGFTSSSAATSTIEKSALRKSYGVDCVDMETATIIEFANAHKIPVAAFRVVVDPHNQSIPPAALAGLNADGTVSALSTTIALIKRPHHLIGILKLGFQYRQAMKSLSRAARLLTRFLVDAPRANTESHY